MTLREHLAVAAAHIEIPGWFHPNMPRLPELPKVPNLDHLPYTHLDGTIKASSIIAASMSRFLKKLQDQEDVNALDIDYPTLRIHFGMTDAQIDKVFDPFYQAVQEYRIALQTRNQTLEQERVAQWPWAYADMVIAARKEAE